MQQAVCNGTGSGNNQHDLARGRPTDTVAPSFYRAMHFSAKRGIAIACRLSVRL